MARLANGWDFERGEVGAGVGSQMIRVDLISDLRGKFFEGEDLGLRQRCE